MSTSTASAQPVGDTPQYFLLARTAFAARLVVAGMTQAAYDRMLEEHPGEFRRYLGAVAYIVRHPHVQPARQFLVSLRIPVAGLLPTYAPNGFEQDQTSDELLTAFETRCLQLAEATTTDRSARLDAEPIMA